MCASGWSKCCLKIMRNYHLNAIQISRYLLTPHCPGGYQAVQCTKNKDAEDSFICPRTLQSVDRKHTHTDDRHKSITWAGECVNTLDTEKKGGVFWVGPE